MPVPAMDSGDLTPEQANRLRPQTPRQLRYLTRLCDRLRALTFPRLDPLFESARESLKAAKELHQAALDAAPKRVDVEPTKQPRASLAPWAFPVDPLTILEQSPGASASHGPIDRKVAATRRVIDEAMDG